MKRLTLLLILAVLLVCSCEYSSPENKHHGWGFGWENDSTLIQYRGYTVCTLTVDRESYRGVLGYMPNGYPIMNEPLVADTVHGIINTLNPRLRDSCITD